MPDRHALKFGRAPTNGLGPGASSSMATDLGTMVNALSQQSALNSAPMLARSILSERDTLVALARGSLFLGPTIRALTRIANHLSKPLTIAILGEPNAGKSSLANMICGVSALPTMPMPNTRVPTILRYAKAPGVAVVAPSGALPDQILSSPPFQGLTHIEVGLPSEALRAFQIIDYPSTREGVSALPLADFENRKPDIAVWTTTATQAWRESERSIWSAISRNLRGRSLLAVTHIDLLHHRDDLTKLEGRLKPLIGQAFDDLVFVSLKNDQEIHRAKVMGALRTMKADEERRRVKKAKAVLARIAARTLARLPSPA